MDVVVVFAPLIGAFIAGFFGRMIGDRASELIPIGFMGISALSALWVFHDVVMQGNTYVTHIFTFIDSGTFESSWALRIDQLTAVMFAVVSVVSWMIHIYSIGYMDHDPHKSRFFAYLSLFTFFMLLLVSADNFLQQILLRPEDYDIIATLNLNGDYISDALAAQVGGIGIAPGGNIGDGIAVFEATHGTAPGFAGKNRVNPGSLILSAEMMLRYMGWIEAADLIIKGIAGTIANGELTFDLARLRTAIRSPKRKARTHDKKEVEEQLEELIPGARLVGTRGFGRAVIRHMSD